MMKPLYKASFTMRLGVACCLLFAGLFVAMVLIVLIAQFAFGGDTSGRALLTLSSVLQNLVAFVLPAVVCAQLFSPQPWHALRADTAPTWRAVAMVLMVYVASVPTMNWLVAWNAGLHLPQALQGVEATLRGWENSAAATTTRLLSMSGWGDMAVMVLVVGVLTGLGEEFFFRGTLLNMLLDRPMNRHWAVLIIGVVFSAFHFQFFGFVPRMLLGMWLGYLLVWTRCLWVPVIAHALNNGMVVLMTFLTQQHIVAQNWLDTVGSHGGPVAAISAVVTLALVFIASRTLPVLGVKGVREVKGVKDDRERAD